MTAVRMHGIVKRFGPVAANDGVDFAIDAGQIVALVGENGAGKSTLMNVLYGLIAPDAGEIHVAGSEVHLASPLDAIRAGLGMVHQHFMLFPSLSVAENVVFAAEPSRRGLFDRQAAESWVRDLAARHGLEVDPAAKVADLPVGVRQRVEILKLLYRSAEVLIFDEPTAVLTPQERAGLFEILGRLKEQGKAIVFITHKLDEVMALSDRAVVMRDGKVVASWATCETTVEELAVAMVGRDGHRGLGLDAGRPPGTPGEVLLEVENLHVPGHGAESVQGSSFAVRAGEIVGIAGVAGNGQTALIQSLIGLRPARSGRVRIAGDDVTGRDVATRRDAGLVYVPEDRHSAGVATRASVLENLVMGHHRDHSRCGFLAWRQLAELSRQLISRFAVKVEDLRQPAASLSGGNQQRLILARELAKNAKIVIAEQPTRGVDISAVEFIHDQLIGHRDAGRAVLLVSAELAEILALSDRILVMYEGRIAGELGRDEATEAQLGLLMAGRAAA